MCFTVCRYIDLATGRVVTSFADIVEAQSSDAAGVFQAIKKGLDAVGVNENYLKDRLVMVSLDGASVNQGSMTGVGKRFQQHVERDILIGWCVNHKFELAILDSIKSKLGVNDNMIALVEEVVDFIFRFYYGSPRRRRIVQHICSLLEEDPAYFSGFSGTRWLASRLRAYKAVWKHYPAIVFHFEEASNGKSEESLKCTGYLRKLKSARFVQSLYFLVDVLEALQPVSVAFQRDDLFVTEVKAKLTTALIHIEGLKHIPGEKYSSFLGNLADNGELKCGKSLQQIVELTNAESVARTEESLHVLVTRMVEALNNRFAFLTTTPYHELSILDHQCMPPLHATGQLAQYGNEEMKVLVEHFSDYFTDEEARAILKQWPALKVAVAGQKCQKPVQVYENLLAARPEDLQAVLLIVQLALTISPSTAGVERGFSAMKFIKNNKRSRMTSSALSDLMRINACDTDVDDFDPQKAISHWVTSAKKGRTVLRKQKMKPFKVATGKHAPQDNLEGGAAREVNDEEPLLPALPPPDSDSDDDTNYLQ